MITKKTPHTILFLFLSVFSYAHNLSITEYHLDEMGLTASESSTLEDENESVTQINRIPSVAQTFTVNGVTFKMIPVEGGTFTMGVTPEMKDPHSTDKPAHQVTLSSYMIGETEVTQELWKAVMGSYPSRFKSDQHPVRSITWNNCRTFISRLNSITGKQFRLPTEAEWEFAARGGNKSQNTRYSGSNDIDEVAWYCKNSDDNTHPVKTKMPNELGIYDMSGNVQEWCQDWYKGYSKEAQINPIGPNSGSGRVARGGCGFHEAKKCSSYYRTAHLPYLSPWTGLRLCLSLLQDTTHDVSSLQSIVPKPLPSIGDSQGDNNSRTIAQTFTVKGVTFKMIPVEGGTFTMGATPEQEDPSNDEKPAHLVTLSSYMIGETEVTQTLWKAVMGSNPSYHRSTNPHKEAPVDNVSWDDCQVFVAKLSSLTGKRFRLPTEAEWEFAARGGNKSQHTQYSGSSNIDEVAWYYANSNGEFGYKDTSFVKRKKPNELGIYDMSGNVWEWCQDRKGNYSRNAQTNPTGPSSGSERVARGGSFNSSANICCTSVRAGVKPDMHLINFGLRVCLSR